MEKFGQNILRRGNRYLQRQSYYQPIQLFINKQKFKNKVKNQTPVVIFQMGKVGSSSLKQSLLDYGLPCVFHAHNISPDQDNENWRFIYEYIIMRKQPSKFISLVREPIGRNLSAFFENFQRKTGIRFEDSTYTLEQLTDLFLTNYDQNKPLNWFDNYLKPTLGIDIYQHPFSKKKGMAILCNENFELLLLKSEIDNSQKEIYISEFLEIEGFRIINRNVGSNKVYSEVYKELKRSIQLPESYINSLLDSKYTRHFYTDQEISTIKEKWKRWVNPSFSKG